MSDLAIAQVGFIASALAMAFALTAFTWRMRPRVLRLRDDPPPNAHYIELDPDTAEDDDESKARKAAIAKQKEAEVVYHALHYCDGRCSVRELVETINREWNQFYEDWAEYKKHWHISQKFIRDTLDKYDYSKSGDVVRLAGDYAGVYVIVDTVVNGSRGRRLVDVKDLVYVYFGKDNEATVDVVNNPPEVEGVLKPSQGVSGNPLPAPLVCQPVPIFHNNGSTLPVAAD